MDGIQDSSYWEILCLRHTLGGTQELSLVPLPAAGSTKVPTVESSAASLPWIKKPLKVGLLPGAERVTAWGEGKIYCSTMLAQSSQQSEAMVCF